MPQKSWLRTPSSTSAAFLLPPTTRRWIYFSFARMCWSYWFFTLTYKYNSFFARRCWSGRWSPPRSIGSIWSRSSIFTGSIGWLRIRRPRTGSAATGHLTSLEPSHSGTGRTGRASPQCTAMAQMDTSVRCRGMVRKTHNFNSQFLRN
jgi:hypothetical protein